MSLLQALLISLSVALCVDIKCVPVGGELNTHASLSCLLRSAHVRNRVVSYDVCGTPKLGLETINPLNFSVKGPPWEHSMFSLVANHTCLTGPPRRDTVYVILDPFYMPNVGHVIGDDVYPIFRALLLYDLQNCAKLTVLSVTPVSNFPPRVVEIYHALGLSVQALEDTWYPNMVIGISGLNFHLQQVPLAYGGVLDIYRDWVYKRSGVVQVERLVNPSITIILKNLSSADHRNGPINGENLGTWASAYFPRSIVRSIILTNMSFVEQLKLMEETDVLVKSPGSDVMNAVFLKPFSALVILPEVSDLNASSGLAHLFLGHEWNAWFQFRGSLTTVAYPLIFVNETTQQNSRGGSGKDESFWYTVTINELRFVETLHKALKAVV